MMADADAPKSPLGAALESLRSLRKFFATRSAILHGEPIFDMSAETLAGRGYLSPWSFQTWEATIVSVPGLLVGFLVGIFVPNAQEPPVVQWFGRLFTGLLVLLTPWLSYVYAGWLGRASLLPADRTPERMARARRAYVYFSNSSLFLPELLTALTFAIKDLSEQLLHSPVNLPITVPAIWYAITQTTSIRHSMFIVNGYTPGSTAANPILSLNLTEASAGYSMDPDALNGPTRQWQLLTLLAIPATSVAWIVASALISFIAAALIVHIAH